MSIPLFPNLNPRIVDSCWFSVDSPCNDESELIQLEHEHKNWLAKITQKDADILPIGKTAIEKEKSLMTEMDFLSDSDFIIRDSPDYSFMHDQTIEIGDEEEEEDDDDDDSNDDEESETQDDEEEDMDVDVSYDRVEPAPGTDS